MGAGGKGEANFPLGLIEFERLVVDGGSPAGEVVLVDNDLGGLGGVERKAETSGGDF